MSPGIKATVIGAAGNLFLAVIKFIGGVWGHSTALVADAIHSLSDLLTDFVVLTTHQIGKKPADEDHPYGHGRAESLGAVAVGGAIIGAGLWIGYEVWQVIESGVRLTPSFLAAAGAATSVLTKEGLYWYTRIIGERERSPAVIANAWHHRSDALSSIAALIGILGALFGYPLMDPLAGGVVALMVIKVGFDIVRDAVRDLMDTAVSEEQTRKIQKIIDRIPEVLEFHDLRTRKIGGEVFLDVHILVDTDLTVTEGHKAAETVRRRLINAFDSVKDVLVHVDGEDDSHIEPIYPVTREDLKPIVDSILQSTNGQLERTGMRIHYLKGKTIVDVYVRVKTHQTVTENQKLLNDLKTRLEKHDPIDRARVYLDMNHD